MYPKQNKYSMTRYLQALIAGLMCMSLYWIPCWFGLYDGDQSQYYGLIIGLIFALPGFVLALYGIVGLLVSTIANVIKGVQ